MVPILPIAIDLPARGGRDLLRSLHRQLQAAILDGRLHPGLRLPPSRKLASALGISRNTVLGAYDLLFSQAYLTGRQGAGTFVAEALPRRPVGGRKLPSPAARHLSPVWRAATPAFGAGRDLALRFDFRVGLPDQAWFPFDIWRRLSGRALRALARAPTSYDKPDGRPALREAIAGHVSFTRGVACVAEDIVVTAGAQQAFDLIARILVTPRRSQVALEDPGYPPARRAFAAAGARVVGVPVDSEGIVVERLPARATAVVVTPSHQFPLGVAMTLRRRTALLDFARAQGAVIVEDDYDGEFRFEGKPLDSLQTLDGTQSVFYIGTFSKSLFPGLRLGFVVAPPWARDALLAAKQVADGHGPVLEQETLAAFIAEGHLSRHIRKMRRIYGDRRAALLEAIARHGEGRLTPFPSDTGLHAAISLPKQVGASDAAAAARRHGVGVESLDRYAFDLSAPNGLALGIGTIAAEDIAPAIQRLGKTVSELASTPSGRSRRGRSPA